MLNILKKILFNKKCPKCNSRNIIRIAYGLFESDNYPKNRYLGGCTVEYENTYCKNCKNKFRVN